MTAAHHISEAEACLGQLGEQEDDSSVERSLLGRSIAHSMLSIARNLETVAARWADPADVVEAEIVDGDPLHTAAALLEQIAIGDEGEPRERTIARLVLHATGERYADAPAIAQAALNESSGPAPLHYRVAQAIMALRIELPV
jgi:hypothetical protein